MIRLTAESLIDERIIKLLEHEDDKIKKFTLLALKLAKTRRLPTEALATKLFQQLDGIIKEENNED
ncbi:MAG: hypothetical protein H6Q73_1250 [Firmicutes bacterium]|nr:hypothetical protein [Bacillota bacterium]